MHAGTGRGEREDEILRILFSECVMKADSFNIFFYNLDSAGVHLGQNDPNIRKYSLVVYLGGPCTLL